MGSLATATITEVFDAIALLVKSKAGQRMLRASAPPSREEVASWIEFAAGQSDRQAA